MRHIVQKKKPTLNVTIPTPSPISQRLKARKANSLNTLKQSPIGSLSKSHGNKIRSENSAKWDMAEKMKTDLECAIL
jgi:hypothetical protein